MKKAIIENDIESLTKDANFICCSDHVFKKIYIIAKKYKRYNICDLFIDWYIEKRNIYRIDKLGEFFILPSYDFKLEDISINENEYLKYMLFHKPQIISIIIDSGYHHYTRDDDIIYIGYLLKNRIDKIKELIGIEVDSLIEFMMINQMNHSYIYDSFGLLITLKSFLFYE